MRLTGDVLGLVISVWRAAGGGGGGGGGEGGAFDRAYLNYFFYLFISLLFKHFLSHSGSFLPVASHIRVGGSR